MEIPRIFGTGLVCLDLVVSSDHSEPVYYWSGGTCGNVLTILSFLGWESYPISRLNGDTASMRVKTDMKSWGVNLDFAEQEPTTNTPIITQENSLDKKGNPVHKFHWKNCPTCGAWLPNYRSITIKSNQVIKEKNYTPSVFFFDRVSPGALDLAKHFKSQGAIIYFEPSAKAKMQQLESALELSDIIKYSNESVLIDCKDVSSYTSAFLEIQTLGSKGLRYRSHSDSTIGNEWKFLQPFENKNLVDTCGCGDWTTSGIISKLCNRKIEELYSVTEDVVTSAMIFGQALASWNCNFLGARGGMYSIPKKQFEEDIEQILSKGVLDENYKPDTLNTEILEEGICLCSH